MVNILKFLYSPLLTKRKILDTVDHIKLIIHPICKEKFWIEWYGAYDIDPKNLVLWICVESDKVKSEFESNSKLLEELRETFLKNNYPEQAIPFIHIGFESQETVDRESNGNWYNHFK
jgi:hypothetical protein